MAALIKHFVLSMLETSLFGVAFALFSCIESHSRTRSLLISVLCQSGVNAYAVGVFLVTSVFIAVEACDSFSGSSLVEVHSLCLKSFGHVLCFSLKFSSDFCWFSFCI